MAKFLMMTGPYAGHVTPCVPIARKLVQRGHEVVWITGREYQARVEATGARFHPLPKESDPDGVAIYEFYPELEKLKGLAQIRWWVKHVFLDPVFREIDVIDAVLRAFPAEVVIGDSVTISLYFRSEMRGPPAVEISVLPPYLPSCDTAPYGLGLRPGNNCLTRTRNRVLDLLIHHVLLRDLTVRANSIRQRLGLEPLTVPLFESRAGMVSSVLILSTPAFEYFRRDLPGHFQFIGPILPEPNRAFQRPLWWSDLSGPEPVILVNQGTIATVLDDLIVPALSGLKGQQMQVVAVPVKEGQLGELPANVHANVFIPFDHLLPHVDVMVTNGGYGGTQLALAHGVPLVVAGETEDKREVAARVEWSGAGINLRKQRPSPKAIREAVKEVLENPVYRQNAKRIQADFAKYDAPTRAAELLEALARDKRLRHGAN
jgi:UDP:flavonoid glycosyltransferase YjiC (YdhE family)